MQEKSRNKWRQLWKDRAQVVEGMSNYLFKKETVEEIALERLQICHGCESFDPEGKGCFIAGTQPCCSNLNGGCGCSLRFATRSMSKSCPKEKWDAIMTHEEEEKLKETVPY